jgi:hypothetical protein
VNYFAPLSHGERTPITRDQVWSGLRGHRRLARAARKKELERQISEDAQVEQYELLTRNIRAMTEAYTVNYWGIYVRRENQENIICESVFA